MPAFVVTLAGNLGWNGLMLNVLGATGTVNLPNDGIVSKLYNTIYGQTRGGLRRRHGRRWCSTRPWPCTAGCAG